MLVGLLGDAVWMDTATAPAAKDTTWTGLGVPFTRDLPGYSHAHRVCGGVTKCVIITTYHDGLPWILRDA
jgi:hypothetical protein